MSFPFEAVFSLGDKLVALISKFVPDREKAQQLAGEVQKAVAAAMQAEMASQWLVGQWRAMAMLAVTCGIVFRYCAGWLDFAANETDLAMGLIWLIGFTGYSVTGDTIKNLLTVLRRPKEDRK